MEHWIFDIVVCFTLSNLVMQEKPKGDWDALSNRRSWFLCFIYKIKQVQQSCKFVYINWKWHFCLLDHQLMSNSKRLLTQSSNITKSVAKWMNRFPRIPQSHIHGFTPFLRQFHILFHAHQMRWQVKKIHQCVI